MTTKINLSEFKTRLEENTEIGNPNIKVSPFAIFKMFHKSKKKFFGKLNDSSFKFTKNGSINVIPYVIEGTMNDAANSQTEVKYEVKKIWMGYLWLRTIPLFIIAFTFILYNQNPRFLPLAIMVDLFFLLLHFYLLQQQKNELIKFENDFKEIAEITD